LRLGLRLDRNSDIMRDDIVVALFKIAITKSSAATIIAYYYGKNKNNLLEFMCGE